MSQLPKDNEHLGWPADYFWHPSCLSLPPPAPAILQTSLLGSIHLALICKGQQLQRSTIWATVWALTACLPTAGWCVCVFICACVRVSQACVDCLACPTCSSVPTDQTSYLQTIHHRLVDWQIRDKKKTDWASCDWKGLLNFRVKQTQQTTVHASTSNTQNHKRSIKIYPKWLLDACEC